MKRRDFFKRLAVLGVAAPLAPLMKLPVAAPEPLLTASPSPEFDEDDCYWFSGSSKMLVRDGDGWRFVGNQM